MEEASAILVGHSFVKRYARWIGSSSKMAPPSRAHVCNRITDLELYGISGLMSSQLHDDDTMFQASRYDIVIIDCGTNDLARGKSHIDIANNVLLFARRCLEAGSSLAVITSILPRTNNIRGGIEDFHAQMTQYNAHVKSLCVRETKISYHTHKGFSRQLDATTKQPVLTWSDDGIHPACKRRQPQQKSGMEKYNESVKTALHRAVHRMNYYKG